MGYKLILVDPLVISRLGRNANLRTVSAGPRPGFATEHEAAVATLPSLLCFGGSMALRHSRYIPARPLDRAAWRILDTSIAHS